MLLQREMEQDSMLWQTPTLALTAQAFLLTIALNKDSSAPAVFVSAGLGVLVALLSLQLMAKHRFLNELDRAQLHRIEDDLTIPHISRRSYFYAEGVYRVPDELAGKHRGAPTNEGFLQRVSSYSFWVRGLWLFALVNVGILAVQIWSLVFPHLHTP
ncbi:hypothetical protein [Arthrobacter sp. FW306-2-2C-D06B]|uniref:hypothetical protein n=1 Tax=Arthrobacter sp. FW306-2-2C-D06B TaxID=2879618 RepID=UPI001F2F134A|nr:hypothetical protein [Arthrobacter sp. FW306-2-2C-D06B]UKA59142.1 hypothetical protein LFT47_01955 [Arthrobacter sp. FW306-2-2C-D06B]